MLITAPVPLLRLLNLQDVVDMKTPERLTRGDLDAFSCSEVCCNILEVLLPSYTVKKGQWFSGPQLGCHLPNSPGRRDFGKGQI